MKTRKIIALSMLISALAAAPAFARLEGINRIFYIVSDEMSMTQKAMSSEAGLNRLVTDEIQLKSATASDSEELSRAFLRASISNGSHVFIYYEDFLSEIYKIVKENPELKVIVMGGKIPENKKLTNLYALSYDEERAAFLAGYTAGALSENKKVALLTSEKECAKTAEVKKGFIEGVKKATSVRGKKVKIKACIAENLHNDEIAGKVAGHLYSEGTDVIYFVGETGLRTVHAEAAKAGKKVIFVKQDETSYLYPEDKAVLAVVTKNNTRAVEKVFREINEGAHEAERNIEIPMKPGEYEFTVNPAGHNDSWIEKEIEELAAE